MGALSFAYDTICSTDSYKSRLSIWHWDSYVFTQLFNIWEPFPVMDPQYSYKNLLISVITWKYYLNVSIECNLSKSDLIYNRNSYFTACGLHFFCSGDIRLSFTFTMVSKFFLVSSVVKQAFLIRGPQLPSALILYNAMHSDPIKAEVKF